MTSGADRFVQSGNLDYDAWKRALHDGVLLGQVCDACGHATAAPKAACALCGSFDLTATTLPTEGEVYAETTVAVAPEPFEGPYQVALVDLGDAMVMARIDADGDAEIGAPVRLCGVVGEQDPGPLFELRDT